MAYLSVQYLGKTLSSPIIVSSSSLTGTVEGVKKCADAGAGAVVLKSLFEEQIEAEMDNNGGDASPEYIHPETEDYFREMGKHLGPADYLKLIEGAKKSVSVPVFASLNCAADPWWTRYAEQIATSGADGIELNIARMPRGIKEDSESVENRIVDIVEKVNKEVPLPLAVKIGPYFSSLPRLAARLKKAGASGIVLFNRFYQMDIDIEGMKIAPGYQFSGPGELYTSLRWISILSGQIECDFAASTGVHDGKAVIKQLLAGAAAVQVCSVLYQKGFGEIRKMNAEIEEWMGRHKFAGIADFKGKLSQIESASPEAYERLQYIKALTGIS
jgi:dihydroorotate dehydrogenase (fumarate)